MGFARSLAFVLVAALLSPAPRARAADDVLILVAFGDSTTARRATVERVWPERVAATLEAGGQRTFVVNSGKPGNTTLYARERFERDVLLRAPGACVIQFGLNDSAVDVQEGRSEPRVALSDYEAHLRFMVGELRARGVPTILMTPNPLRWTDANRALWESAPYDVDDPRGLNRFNARYAEAVRRIAAEEGVGLVDVYRSFDELDVDGCAALLEDGIHPNDAGHALIAGAVVEALGTVDLDARLVPGPAFDDPPDIGDWLGDDPPLQLLVRDGRAVDAWPRRGIDFERTVYEPDCDAADWMGWSPRGRSPSAIEERWMEARGVHWTRGGGFLRLAGSGNDLWASESLGDGDFGVWATLALEAIDGTAAALELGAGSWLGFDSAGGGGGRLFTEGWLFGAGVRLLGPAAERIAPFEPFRLRVRRSGPFIRFAIDGREVARVIYTGPIDRLGLRPRRGALRVHELFAATATSDEPVPPIELPRAPGHSLPVVDLASETARQVVVDRDPEQYLGHPTTVLLEDGRTLVCVYPLGHGQGGIVMKRSTDGGLTWSERLPTPASWTTSREVPTIHRVVDAGGTRRLILWSGLWPARLAVSEDDGASWSELAPAGDWGGIVVMGSVVATRTPGEYLAFFHDDGRFRHGSGNRTRFDVFQTRSTDGGLTWSEPVSIATHPHAHLCEPGAVRSPDGRTLALLLRENSRTFNSFVIFSDDEGASWSTPRQLPAALTGDRHTARYAPDGRLFVTFRDTTRASSTQGDWVGWVGTWNDLAHDGSGQYRVRLMDNHHAWDCAYPGLELLLDGTFVTTTYGHWTEGQPPYVVSVRLRLEELDARLAGEER